MKTLRYSLVFLFLSLGIIFSAQETKIPSSLRGGIRVDQHTIKIALAMQSQGWEYIMPVPKSRQAMFKRLICSIRTTAPPGILIQSLYEE